MKRLLFISLGIVCGTIVLPLLLERLIIATREPVRCDGGEEGFSLDAWTDEQIERVLRNCG